MQACQRALQKIPLEEEGLLLCGERIAEEVVVDEPGRAQAREAVVDERQLPVETAHLVLEEDPVLVGVAEPRQRPPEPLLHLVGREGHREDAHELGLEVVRLVHHEHAARPELLALPLPEGEEVGGIGAEDRAVEGGELRARVGALAEGPARAPAQPVARGHARGLRALAEVVLATLHELDRVSELALVLILEELLRGEEVGVAAPARERQGDVALADTGRGLEHEHARALDTLGLPDGRAQGLEQARLRGARLGAGREVGEEIVIGRHEVRRCRDPREAIGGCCGRRRRERPRARPR